MARTITYYNYRCKSCGKEVSYKAIITCSFCSKQLCKQCYQGNLCPEDREKLTLSEQAKINSHENMMRILNFVMVMGAMIGAVFLFIFLFEISGIEILYWVLGLLGVLGLIGLRILAVFLSLNKLKKIKAEVNARIYAEEKSANKNI